MYTATIPMFGDNREIEVSAERRGQQLRLRARICKNGRVEHAQMVDYPCEPGAIASFTALVEDAAGLEGLRLFPDDLDRIA